MNKIDKDELFRHLSDFWKTKGVELQEGSCTQGIKKGCELLAETVNLSQQALERARAEMEKHLIQMRQIIHEKTAPRTSPSQSRADSSSNSRKTANARSQRKNQPKGKQKNRKGKA